MTQPREISVYRDPDGDVNVLCGKTIAVVGYGNLGRSLALNLQDATDGRIIVGSRDDPSAEQAREDGFDVQSIADATGEADVVLFLVPDEVQPAVYAEHVGPRLRPGSALVFASGYNLAFDPIVPPPEVDVLLFAPKMLGSAIRRLYLDGQGYVSYVSVERDASGRGWPLLLALAKGAGSLRRGALEISARDESHLDLYGEQGFGPWLGTAVLTSFFVGVEAGLPPEGLLMEMYLSGEMAQTFQAMADEGFLRSTKLHGYAAAFGGMVRSMSLDREVIERSLREALQGIQSGDFARQLRSEVDAGYPSRTLLAEMLQPEGLVNQVEDRLYGQLNGHADGGGP